MERAETFKDASVATDFRAVVTLLEDRHGNGEWRVEYFDDDAGCYVTIFAGPEAKERARDYFGALKTGTVKIIREGAAEH
jgi:hypothetical protein